MSFKTRILLTVIGACVVCSLGALFISARQAEEAGYQALNEKSAAILSRLEAARSFVATQGMLKGLVEEVAEKYPDGNLPKETKEQILRVVPISASIALGNKSAEQDHYKFRVASLKPRNEKNLASADEAEFLRRFSADTTLKEISHIDTASNSYWLMRPVRVNAADGCMVCHGHPNTSPWGNGKDILGREMENMQDNDLVAMFKIESDLAPLQASISDRVKSAGLAILAVLTVCVLAAIFFVSRPLTKFLNSIKDIVGSLSKISSSVGTSATEISQGSNSLAEGSQSQASSLEETAATVEEISTLSGRNADNARSADQLAKEAQQAVSDSVVVMTQMVDAVNAIKDSSDETQKIIKSIDAITFQTNLLALNAAVEAARAGEAGAGFAVVAEEVRILAQRSAQAAQETADRVKNSSDLAHNGAAISETVSASLEKIIVNSRKTAEIIEEISLASSEQSTGLTHINQAVGELDRVTQQNAAAAEQSAAAAAHLREQTEDLDRSIGKLAKLVGISV